MRDLNVEAADDDETTDSAAVIWPTVHKGSVCQLNGRQAVRSTKGVVAGNVHYFAHPIVIRRLRSHCKINRSVVHPETSPQSFKHD